MWTSELERQKFEDKPVNFEDLTLINEQIEDSFMRREPHNMPKIFIRFVLYK